MSILNCSALIDLNFTSPEPAMAMSNLSDFNRSPITSPEPLMLIALSDFTVRRILISFLVVKPRDLSPSMMSSSPETRVDINGSKLSSAEMVSDSEVPCESVTVTGSATTSREKLATGRDSSLMTPEPFVRLLP